ncbi:MAG: DNA polymerase III subunit gamma/tau [Acidimicrobiales bacterium]
MEYQSLYRRYRPQKFGEVKGQHHVIRALQNAVRDNRVGHAYLLSGPRGTGKTTLARILAKVLNCEQPIDGEPCGQCPPCKSIEAGTSFDLHELDAASNNKVDDMRDLLSKVALGTPGRTKVYLLDEVHMLSSGAENALLKTLEEPPDHVVFVLATTEPHKVVATIRSRTQHLELTLLSADEMAEHVRWISGDASLGVTDDMVEYVVRVGGGSARDTLSALDQVLAAGGVAHDDSTVNELLSALADHDAARAIATVAEATRIGRDPRVIGESLIDALRSVFLVAMGAAAAQLTETERARAQQFSTQLSPGALTHALEIVGTALVDMRQAPDPRIDLEVALVKLTRVASDTSLDALVARLERLERRLERGADVTDTVPAAAAPPPKPPPAPPTSPARAAAPAAPVAPTTAAPAAPATEPPAAPAAPAAATGARRPADEARQQLGSNRRPGGGTARSAPATTPSRPAPAAPTRAAPPRPVAVADAPAPPAVPASGAVDGDLVSLWTSTVVPALSAKTRALFLGVPLAADGDSVTFTFSTDTHRARCDQVRADVEAVFGQSVGRAIAVRLVDDRHGDSDEHIDLTELEDAPAAGSLIDQLTTAFPGAEIIEE